MVYGRWRPSLIAILATCPVIARGTRCRSGLATITAALLIGMGRTYFVDLTWHSSVEPATRSD